MQLPMGLCPADGRHFTPTEPCWSRTSPKKTGSYTLLITKKDLQTERQTGHLCIYSECFLSDLGVLGGKVKVKVAQACPALCDPMDCVVHGILQARILEWVAFHFSSRSSQPRNQTQVSHTAGRFFINWTMREAQRTKMCSIKSLVIREIHRLSPQWDMPFTHN